MKMSMGHWRNDTESGKGSSLTKSVPVPHLALKLGLRGVGLA
jgi:hypothetical protein